jgi:general stress protein 26
MRGYGIETQTDSLLTWDWVTTRLDSARNYWIASTRPDGRPHSAPVWGVWLDGALYFGTNRSAVKARNLAARADVVVHLESGDEVVILEGKAVDASDTPLMPRINARYKAKYDFDPGAEPSPEALTLCVRPQIVLAWLEHDFIKTATRWELGASYA